MDLKNFTPAGVLTPDHPARSKLLHHSAIPATKLISSLMKILGVSKFIGYGKHFNNTAILLMGKVLYVP